MSPRRFSLLLPRSRKHSWAWPLATLALLVTTILSPQSSLLTPHHTFAQGESPPRPDNPYGVNLFLHKEVEPWKIEKTLQMAAAATRSEEHTSELQSPCK